MGGALVGISEKHLDVGRSTCSGRGSGEERETNPMNSRIGRMTARTRLDEEGASAATNTAARHRNAINLRVEIKLASMQW